MTAQLFVQRARGIESLNRFYMGLPGLQGDHVDNRWENASGDGPAKVYILFKPWEFDL
jgi:hypothetical protein